MPDPRVRRPGGPPAEATHGATADHFRPDIEGLRGVAILLVVAFHALPGLMGGGFVGVDVFFVISGFLITGLLWRELQRTGGLDLATFYTRRVRRLLPAAALAVLGTLLLSAWIIPPLDLPRVAGDGVAAAFSVANLRFAVASGDYFSAVATPSPFLHFWSLSVEEQFYLVWPATLLLALRMGHRPVVVALVVAAIAAISLVAAVVLTDAAAAWAFYSLPTRAWQLALGGLLAMAALNRHQGRWLSRGLAVLGWVGVVAVLLAGWGFDELGGYPGLWALVPTLGAAAIIAGGDRAGGPGLLLRTRPLRFFGRISYALYLWHWPLLVLPAVALGGELDVPQRLVMVTVAVLVATASTVLVEEPIRRGPSRVSGRRQLAIVGTLGMVLLLGVSFGVGATTWRTEEAMAASRGDDGVAGLVPDGPGTESEPVAGPEDALVEIGGQIDVEESLPAGPASPAAPGTEPDGSGPAPASPGPPTDGASPGPSSLASTAPGASPAASPRKRDRQPTPRPTRPPFERREPPVIRLPANAKPPLWQAKEDEELLRDNGCLHTERVTRPKDCSFGAERGKLTVALVGDSHASHWFPAIARVAADNDWRLVTFVKVSCPFSDVLTYNFQLQRAYRECLEFNENAVAELRRIKPDLVLTALSRWQHPIDSDNDSASAQGAGIARMLNRIPGQKVVIADVPYARDDIPACLSANIRDVRACAVPEFDRSTGGSPAREKVAARQSGGAFIDFGDVICGGNGSCPVVRNGMIVFRDTHHLTATFSRWLAPALDRALAQVLERSSAQ